MKAIWMTLSMLAGFFILTLNKPDKQEGDQSGEGLYKQYCLSCHQPDGNGVRGMYPPLAGNPTVSGPADTVIKIVLTGLQGPIEVNGREYNQVMPAQDYLTDKQIANVLTFIRNNWNNKAEAIKPASVTKARKAINPVK